MTSSTGRSGCTSPETSMLSLTMVQCTSNNRSLTESAAIKVRNLCLLLRFRQRPFMDIQRRKKKPKTVLAYCLNSRDFHIDRKNWKSRSLQFGHFFFFARISILFTVLDVYMLVNELPLHLLEECVFPPTAIPV